LAFRPDLALLSALVVIGAAVPAFRELFGYGLGLLVLAGLAVTGMLSGGRVRSLARGALTLALLLALYRVYHEWTDLSDALEPERLYYFAALVLGALLPALLASLARSGLRPGPLTMLLRVGLIGALAAVAPLAVWVLAGELTQPAFLVGLPVGVAFLLSRWEPRAAAETTTARLLALLMACAAFQFTSLLEPIGLRTRTERVEILAAVAALALFWMASTAWLERRSKTLETAPPA
ncbi:MAG TPA: hypothetical protein VFU47_09240, partial [Armatimonadota bacterium]|nr:hypothetical protein [Armatimonadota bacterium]